MVTSGSWALQQLVRYLAELAPAPDAVPDRRRTLRIGMERAAEVLDAEVGAIILDGKVTDTVGFGSRHVPETELLSATEGRDDVLMVTGLGACHCFSAPVGQGGHLVLARSGDSFDPEEQTIIRALGRILSLSLRSVDALSAERSLRRESDKRAREALRDPLTRLPNRALLLDRLERSVRRAIRRKSSMAVLFMDMDGFKVVNDTLGHASGDALLRAVAERLSGAMRSVDTVARLGGDEFAVLIDDLDGIDFAYSVAERILEVLEPPFVVSGRSVTIRVSIGIAIGPRPDETPDLLLRDADLAMYRTKSERPGGYCVFAPAMHEDLVERMELEAELREGIGLGELACMYQPIVDLSVGTMWGVESLVRWLHPDKGLLSPAVFLPIAERAGLMTALGNWVLEESCRQLSRWQRSFQLPHSLCMSVNLASSQLAWEGLASFVARNLSEWQLDASQLVLEITENAVVAAQSRADACLAELRDLGTPVALDDFGTGYSSLSRLRELPVDILKIDRSFVSGIPEDSKMRVLTASIVRLSRELKLQTIAEGIETEEELRAVAECDCELGQGYYFSHPLPPEQLDEILGSGVALPLARHSAVLLS